MFKAAYGSNDKLKALQELLFNKDSSLSLAIVDTNLENILYSNKTFQATFNDLKILNKVMLDISPTTLNTSSCYSSLKLETMPDISLSTFLQNNMIPENHTLNLQGNHHSNSYEIRLTKIIWDGESAYALIFQTTLSKQQGTTLDVIKSAEEEKEKMIATVSHELRTPINGILGLVEMVSARTTDPQALIYLDNCKSCSKLLLYLVNSILNLSQFRNNKLAFNKEFLSLGRYLEEIRSLYLFSSQQKGINFIIDKDPRVPQKIHTDQYKLTGILVNLLSNAMKFTFKGSVALKIFPAAKDSNKIVFSVEDTGIGIQETDKAKLFKTFGVLQQKGKSINSQGVGLGLTIAKGLVEALSENGEGKIEFESEYNKGSKFSFKLDIAATASNLPGFKIKGGALNDTTNILNDTAYLLKQSLYSNRNPEINIRRYTKIKYNNNGNNKFSCSGINSACVRVSSPQKIKSHPEILIVDDYPLNIIAATFILEKLGYQVTKAFSAEEALELLKKSKKRFCLIITDIQMPTMDELQLSRIIKEMIVNGKMYGLPIVGLTSKKLTEKDRREFKECGIDFSLEKPLNKDEQCFLKSIFACQMQTKMRSKRGRQNFYPSKKRARDLSRQVKAEEICARKKIVKVEPIGTYSYIY